MSIFLARGHYQPNDEARLTALHSLNLLDTPASEAFDRITRMAAQLFKLPVAAVSLTDTDRQWFKSRVGVEHQSIPRFKAPCGEVAETSDVLVIEDFAVDPRYCDSLLAVNGTRFYAGTPLITRDGYALGALCVLGPEPRKAELWEIASLKDLAAIVMDQIELQHAIGRVDAISGFPNRMQLMEDLNDLAAEAPNQERVAAIVSLGSSQQLERYGRVMGASYVDRIVKDAGSRLKVAKEPDTKVYHVSATQFAFIAPRGYGAADFAKRVQDVLQQDKIGGNGRILATTAIGITSFIAGVDTPHDVLKRLTSALQEARTSGTSSSIFSQSADDGYRRKFKILHDFEAALQSGDQLRIVLQPRIDLRTRQVCGAEVLLRWNHPELGQLSPVEFIPIIEASPLIHDLTQWVLANALNVLAEFEGKLTLSVNVSTADLKQPAFASDVLSSLFERHLPASCLELEVTESMMMAHCATSDSNLRHLVDAGVDVAIDDFGTGYSCLSYLQRLPITTLKIDRSFVSKMSVNGKDHALVDTLLNLAQKLGYKVVAEGIEDERTAGMLQNLGCDQGQGYLFSRPLEMAGFTRWYLPS